MFTWKTIKGEKNISAKEEYKHILRVEDFNIFNFYI